MGYSYRAGPSISAELFVVCIGEKSETNLPLSPLVVARGPVGATRRPRRTLAILFADAVRMDGRSWRKWVR